MRGEEGGGEIQGEGGIGVEVVPLDQVAHGADEDGLDAAFCVGHGEIRLRHSCSQGELVGSRRTRDRALSSPVKIARPAAKWNMHRGILRLPTLKCT
ncbi:hypothetical protein G6F57_022215 [Rhizopus arrhizus]|nr:hypothetical protein G6F57_022215 [Rhizopus arrhizus]